MCAVVRVAQWTHLFGTYNVLGIGRGEGGTELEVGTRSLAG